MKWKQLMLLSMLSAGTAFATMANAARDVRGYWKMDDGVGLTVADASGNNNTGSAQGAAWAPGVHNASLRLTDHGMIDCGNDASLNPSKAITLEAWIKVWKPNFSDQPAIVSKEGSYALYLGPESVLSLRLWLNGKETILSSKPIAWSNSKWMHAAATFDGTTLSLYVNGEKNNSITVKGRPEISAGKSSCTIGSISGKSVLRGNIDEVRIAGRAFAASEIKSTYEKGLFEIERKDSRFSAFFRKKQKRVPTAVVPGFLWIEAEDFFDYGGWKMDTQFVPQMGSPYLLATGIGEPVDDALALISIPEAGTYRLWVRNKNWLKEFAPGTFQVRLAGKTSDTVFGNADNADWVWQDGGTFNLKKADATLILKDLTGYYGRCDAIILTQDLDYQPPVDLDAYQAERDRLTGADSAPATLGDYDVIVVGGGVAGCNAAIASARTGAKTALIQNRPMLGGNNSAELGVPVLGPADFGKKNSRETGLNEEAGREQAYNYLSKWSQGAEVLAAKEPNLTVFLNTHVCKAEMEKNKIKAVQAFNMISGERTRYTGKQFIDCTGDGWLGYYAGAEYMFGREAKDTFGESNAPDKADDITMSGSLFEGSVLGYRSIDTGVPSPFIGPEWLWDLTYNTKNLEARKRYENTYRSGTWWIENRGTVDDCWDPERARDELIMVSLSYWNWSKNHSNNAELARNRKLTDIPIGNAKRETRRLVGDHILTQDEVLRAEPFPDRIGYGGWGLDVHHPDGIFSTEGPFDFNTHTPLHNIPFRILYSKNISNLLFAGRDISCTHVALGTLRVQATTGVMGQAVGTAAALCVQKNVNPRGLYQSHMSELQQQLLKDDQSILDLKNEDAADMARGASVTASSSVPGQSFAQSNAIPSGKPHPLSCERATMFHRGNIAHIDRVSLWLKSTKPTATQLTVTVRAASEMEDFLSTTDLTTATATVPAQSEGWVQFKVSCDVTSDFIALALPQTDGLFWSLMKSGPIGGCRAYFQKTWFSNATQNYAFYLDRPIVQPGAFDPQNVVSGATRIYGTEMNMWKSDPAQEMPQWVELNLGETKQINSVYLTFDTDVSDAKHCSWDFLPEQRMVPECVRDYQVLAYNGSTWIPLVNEKNNYQRHRIHRFPALSASKLKIIVTATNGDPSARIYEVRAYNE